MIEFERVSKQFTMRYGDRHTFQGLFMRLLRRAAGRTTRLPRPETVKILDDVSFRIARGEALGIIGPNGAGKSTILKLAAGILYPDAGRIVIRGRLAGLLELGAGFHPDLSGRENVYLYGSIIGLERRTIAARMDEIIEFAGLRQFIDVPVKDYSSGMFMRLAFAVTVHVDAEVLLIDEVLSVGDAAFRQKSYQRIWDFKQAGGTIVLVSHELGAVERLCDRVLLLHEGHIMAEGAPAQVIERYLRLSQAAGPSERAEGAATPEAPVRLADVRLFNSHGEPCQVCASGDGLLLRIWLEVREALPECVVQAQICNAGSAGVQAGTLVHGTNTGRHGLQLALQPGTTCLEVSYPRLQLVPGNYYFRVGVLGREFDPVHYDMRYATCPFEVHGPRQLGAGMVALPHTWRRVD